MDIWKATMNKVRWSEQNKYSYYKNRLLIIQIHGFFMHTCNMNIHMYITYIKNM